MLRVRLSSLIPCPYPFPKNPIFDNMGKLLKLRVLVDTTEEEDVFRDIEIRDDQTFQEFHIAIQDAYGFDSTQMASFYMSNDEWDKGQEITLMLMDFDDGSASLEMSKTKLSEFVNEQGQKIIYVFDFMLMWCFYIELVKITEDWPGVEYPRCVHTYGEAPDQYSKELAVKPEDDRYMLRNIRKTEEEEGLSEDNTFEGFDDLEQGE